MYADDLTAIIKDECSASHLFNLLTHSGQVLKYQHLKSDDKKINN